MKKEKKVIIFLILLITSCLITFLGIIIVIYNYSNNPFIGKWKNEIIINNDIIQGEITINKSKTVTLIKKADNESKEYIYKGSWEREEDMLYVTINNNEKYTLSLINDNNSIVFEDDSLELNEYYNEKAIKEYELNYQKDFKEIIENSYYDENSDLDIYEDFSLSWEGVANKIIRGNFPTMTVSNKYTFDSEYNAKEDKNKVVVYLFYGDACKLCDDLLKGLDNLDKNIKSKFVVKMYETWYKLNNESYLKKIADYRNEKIEGLPYIIIGNKSWNNYNDDILQEMIEEINSGTTYDIGEKIELY